MNRDAPDASTPRHRAAPGDETDWHALAVDEVFRRLGTDPERGLNDAEALRRHEQSGPNELVELVGRGPWMILWEQLSGAMVILLAIAAVVSAFLGEYVDAWVILAIIVLNAALGFFQEYRAERAMAALMQVAVPRVRVRRNGAVHELAARELVPGDIVILEAGGMVPADCRLFEAFALKAQEAALTGESEPVEKHVEALSGEDVPLGDRRNMAYMGTTITYGRGRAVVAETGMRTQLGHIAGMLQTVVAETTPLQKRLGQLGRGLAVAALVIVAVVFGLGLLQGRDLRRMLLTALSMAVAAVPEGLPAVATVALAIGARRMLRANALIRKLPAVETLGSVTVICSDKTGTLTENRMTVTVVETAAGRVDLAAANSNGERADAATVLLLAAGALCNDAASEAEPEGDAIDAEIVGDPTEVALVVAAARRGLFKAALDHAFSRIDELPFDSDRKRMETVHRLSPSAAERFPQVVDALQAAGADEQTPIVFAKGAVDSLLDVCTHVWRDGRIEPLTGDAADRIRESNDDLAAEGKRVLGLALRLVEMAADGGQPAAEVHEAADRELVFLGLAGMIDPPRPEVAEAVARCRSAGVRPVMITGDHPLTARRIAQDVGIANEGRVLTGVELGRLSDEELPADVEEVSVYARVSPAHKLRIVTALQSNGHIVAMTGDGVNDAPALKRADIGVAMGVTGTDVSKEAADMVLVDDNFATIVRAVEQGRIVYDNIRKFIRYTLTSNAGEIWVMLLGPLLAVFGVAAMLDMPLPLWPLQILWINLVTDGLPGLALAVEPAERDTMRRPPHPPGEHIFGRGLGVDIVWVGLLMGIVSFGAGWWYWQSPGAAGRSAMAALEAAGRSPDVYWQTVVFTVLTLSQMGNALALRSSRDSLFTIGLFTNKAMLGSVLLTFALQLAVVYLPWLQKPFHTTGLTPSDLAICLALSTIVFAAIEVKKWFKRRQ